MGAGNVKRSNKPEIQLSDPDSIDSIENHDKIKAVLFCDNAELAQHEDLLIQACFCELPNPPETIYKFEQDLFNLHKSTSASPKTN